MNNNVDYKSLAERMFIKRLITETCPDGVVSVIADTWDFWRVITEHAVALKEDILNRKFNEIGLSKVVFRPDSGDPVKILTGYLKPGEDANYEDENCAREDAPYNLTDAECVKIKGEWYPCRWISEDDWEVDLKTPLKECEVKGAVECLWDIFGGELTDKGYKAVSQRVGLIYGDSITPARCLEILQRLEAKGFASCNVVLGIGSYTYQYITRDTLGSAIKGTFAVINGVGHEMMKDPKTDNGVKKSAKGLLKVLRAEEHDGEKFIPVNQCSWDEEDTGALELYFENGNFLYEPSLAEARTRLGT